MADGGWVQTGREMGLDAPVVDRVRETVSRARRGVIIASLTNFVAFCTGISSSLPALRWDSPPWSTVNP